MITLHSPRFEQWIAPWQGDDIPRPKWTKLLAGDVLLSNSIEYANWKSNPVFPIVCEGCWSAECGAHGLARIVSLPYCVIWIKPRPVDFDEFWQDGLSQSNYINESVRIPLDVWDQLASQFRNVPRIYYYPRATRADIARLWVDEMPEEIRRSDIDQLEEHAVRKALASYPLELDECIEDLRARIRWLGESPDEVVEGRMIRLTDNEPVNSIFIDQPSFPEWRAFVAGRENSFVFGDEWALVQ